MIKLEVPTCGKCPFSVSFKPRYDSMVEAGYKTSQLEKAGYKSVTADYVVCDHGNGGIGGPLPKAGEPPSNCPLRNESEAKFHFYVPEEPYEPGQLTYESAAGGSKWIKLTADQQQIWVKQEAHFLKGLKSDRGKHLT